MLAYKFFLACVCKCFNELLMYVSECVSVISSLCFIFFWLLQIYYDIAQQFMLLDNFVLKNFSFLLDSFYLWYQ